MHKCEGIAKCQFGHNTASPGVDYISPSNHASKRGGISFSLAVCNDLQKLYASRSKKRHTTAMVCRLNQAQRKGKAFGGKGPRACQDQVAHSQRAECYCQIMLPLLLEHASVTA